MDNFISVYTVNQIGLVNFMCDDLIGIDMFRHDIVHNHHQDKI